MRPTAHRDPHEYPMGAGTPGRYCDLFEQVECEIGLGFAEAKLADFELCEEQTSLFTTLSHIRDGACVTVEVRHGVPFFVEIEQDHRVA